MNKTNKLPFLIVSKSPFMRGILKFVLETMLHTEVKELESEEKALLFLKNLDSLPCMIVYDYTPNSYLVEDFITYLKDNSKNVRIIVLVDKIREEAKEILKDHSHICLIDETTLPQSLIDEAKLLFVDSPYLNEEPYKRIDINFLSILDGINKNLFIKLGSDKFIKIYQESDNTNDLDLKRYKAKGVDYFYLKSDTANWVIRQIQSQINIFLKANNFRFVLRGASDSTEKRFEQKILRIDNEVHVDKDFKDTIDKAIERILNVVGKEANVNHLLNLIKAKNENYSFFNQKMSLTSLISCTLAKELGWVSKTTIDKLVFASVLADITLAVRPELLRTHSLSDFDKIKDGLTEDDRKIYLSHPQDAANLIKLYFTNAPPDTASLVYQHHETPDGCGFPQGLRAEKISPLAALFIVSKDFSHYFLVDEEPSIDEFILKCQVKYDFINFRKVIKALELLLKKR